MSNIEENMRKQNRDCVLELINEGDICIEIGVWKGEFSKKILKKKPSKLFLIDPFQFSNNKKIQNWRLYSGMIAKNQTDMDIIYKDVVKNLSHNTIEIIKEYSEKALPLFKENSIDFIYIDGDHCEKSVYSDLVNSLRIIKHKGVITGDDYPLVTETGHSVKRAVDKFVKNFKIKNIKIKNRQYIIKL